MHSSSCILGAFAVGVIALSAAAPGVAAATDPVANWEMDEPAGATTMVDSSGNGIHGVIGSAVETHTVEAGAIGYRWTFTLPNEPPVKPERLVVVDDDRLNPGTGDYAFTMRFRTTHSFGNMIQKGQSRNRGGFFKMENSSGKLTCVFRGFNAQGVQQSKSVNSGSIPLNDGAWHVVTCERTSDRVTMTIDGSRVRRGLGPTGRIFNDVPLTLAGKPNCDQIKIFCDYFAGDMDYVRIATD